MSLHSMNPGSIYGILEPSSTISGCEQISTPGSYVLTSTLTGTDGAIPYYSGYFTTCILINSTSNVDINCQGNTINVSGFEFYYLEFDTAMAIENSTNVTIRNCKFDVSTSDGLALNVDTNTMFRNNTAFGYNPNYNTTAFYGGSYDGEDSVNTSFINDSASGVYRFVGISGYNSTYANNTALNTVSSAFYYGAGVLDNSTVSGNTVTNCSEFSIVGSGDNITDNLIKNDHYIGLDIAGIDYGGNLVSGNNVSGTTGTDAYEGGSGFVLDGLTNAPATLVNNIAYNNSGPGYLIFQDTDLNVLNNDLAYNNTIGFSVRGQYNLASMVNPGYTFGVGAPTLQLCDNESNCFDMPVSNNLSNDVAVNNTYAGFYTVLGLSTTYLNDTATGNGYGFLISNSNDTVLSGIHFYNNSNDFMFNNTASQSNYTMVNSIFDNPKGSMQNYTNLSISDTVAITDAYTINWSSNSSSLPAGKVSFVQKFVNISTVSGAPSIDSIVWSWLSSELTGYNVSRFQLWKYDSSGWSLLNNTPGATALSLANMNPASIYGVLQDNDTTPPVVNLISPVSGAITNLTAMNFTFNTTDDSSPTMNCSMYLDGAVNQTNSSVQNATTTMFQVSGISDGVHTWNVTCMDQSNNRGSSATRNFTVNTVAPSVTLNSPANLSIFNVSSVNFNFTTVDNLSSTMNCSIFLDGALNQTNASTSNNTATILTISGIPDGFHYWSVQCKDNANNVGTSVKRNFTVDTTAPVVTLNSPANLSIFNVSSVNFNFTTVDNLSSTMNCSIFLDGALNQTNAATANNTPTLFTISAIPDGFHYWSVQCISNASNVGTSVKRNFTVDTVPPTVTLNSPANLSIFNVSSVNFNFTTVDNLSSTMNCSIFLDGALNQTNAATANNTPTLFTISAIPDGFHYWSVQCISNASNVGTSVKRNFTVDTVPPTVTLNSPANLSIFNVSSVNFNFTTVDNLSSTMNCSIYLDGALNQTNAATANNTPTLFTISGIPDGYHLWSVQCADNADNVGTSVASNVAVDTSIPVIQLNSPVGGATVTTSTVPFNFTVVSNFSATMNCSLYLDGNLTATNISAANDTAISFSVSSVMDGSHNWSVSCMDISSNVGVSATQSFIVNTFTSEPTNPPTLPQLSASLSSNCTGNVVTVSNGGSQISGVTVIVDDASSLGTLYSGTSDDSGHLNFSGCGLSVRITVEKDGYQTEQFNEQTVACGQCVQCTQDSDCPDADSCVNQSCVAVQCSCGQIANHTCSAYGCCSDSQCPSGQYCQGHTCQYPSTTTSKPVYQCTSDGDCASDQSCNIPAGAKGGNCQQITGCGAVANHVLSPYQCGSGPYCPSCGDGQICLDNVCKSFDLRGPSSGFIGDAPSVQALEDNLTCSGCDLRITDPTGKVLTGKTDASGNFSLPLKVTGTYTVAYMKNGTVVKTVEINALPKSAPLLPSLPTTVISNQNWFPWMLLLLIIIAVALYWLRIKKPRK